MPERKNFAILTTGEWGAAFGGFVVAPLGHNVLFVVRSLEEEKTFSKTCRVERLPDFVMSRNIRVTSNLEKAVMWADVLVFSSRAKTFRPHFKEIYPYLKERKKTPDLLHITKGFEQGTHKRMSQIILEEDESLVDNIACLSGPNIAKEIAKGAVAGAVIGAYDQDGIGKRLQRLLNNPQRFMAYTTHDIIGVEYGGALKNVLSLGAGMVYALDIWPSTMALYFTRALEEMVNVGVNAGEPWEPKAHAATLRGLSGAGDLFVACWSGIKGGATRNFRAGQRLAEGQTIEEVLRAEKTVEGLYALESAIALVQDKGVPIPLIQAIDGVVNKGLKVEEGVIQLLGQQPVKEHNGRKGLDFDIAVQLKRGRHKLASLFSRRYF